MENTENDLRHEIKFENHMKTKNNFFIETFIFFFKKYFLFLDKHFLKIYMNSIALAFFSGTDTMKHRYALAKALAFADCQGEFRMLVYIDLLKESLLIIALLKKP